MNRLFEIFFIFLPHLLHFMDYSFFRILADMCSSETESCKKFVSSHLSAMKRLLIKCESNTHLSSRGVSTIRPISLAVFPHYTYVGSCNF